ncbi:hypothetical protein E2562_003391 [Oryza meyeriana var. granulata]|uniref:Uncharacterized protein n=1 Tax=Oryza meyeriana var. granulata TaxID=110450 RepID=A0A6G1EEE8_9ORYZ|nr:hypothetical protein E2562_003391 [Oryza meyeriana var. granulata]
MPRLRLPLLLLLLPITLTLFLLFPSSPRPPHQPLPCGAAPSDAIAGRWVPTPEPSPSPLYTSSCPFHRNAWNCLRNNRPPLAALSWAPTRCGGAVVPRIDAAAFLAAARGRRIGLVGDSLSENLVVALLCALRSADGGARKWKRRGAWRGGYFPRDGVVVAYHRAVLLAKYTWQPVENSKELHKDGIKGTYRVDVDNPADDWSPRHFHGGEWDHNGSCVFDRLLQEHEIDLWFDPRFGGVNKEARLVNTRRSSSKLALQVSDSDPNQATKYPLPTQPRQERRIAMAVAACACTSSSLLRGLAVLRRPPL